METENFKHTPEPWQHDNFKGVYDSNGRPIIFAGRGCDKTSLTEDEANAARIVACVNACEGMIDPANEIAALRLALDNIKQREMTLQKKVNDAVVLVAELKAQNKELLGALTEATRYVSYIHKERFEAIINKAKGSFITEEQGEHADKVFSLTKNTTHA